MRKFLGFDKNLKIFIWGQFLVALGMTFWALFFNLYLDSMGFEKSRIGSILAVSNLGTALFSIPVGMICARFSLKQLLIIGLLLSSVCYLGAVFSEDVFFISLFVFGASGFGTFHRIAMGTFIMDNATDSQRTYAFSASFALLYVGSIAGFALAGYVRGLLSELNFAAHIGYRYVIFGGIVLALSALVPFALLRNTCQNRRASVPFSFSSLRRLNWAFLLKAILPHVFITCGAGVVVQFMNLYFKDVFRLSDNTIGYLMAAQGVATGLAALLAPVLAERFGRVRTVVFTEIASIPFMIWMGATGNVLYAQICFVVRAALMNMASPVANAMLMEFSSREEQSILNALLVFVQAIMWSVAAWIYGHLLGGSYSKSFYVAALLYAIAALLYFRFFSGMERRGATREVMNLPPAT